MLVGWAVALSLSAAFVELDEKKGTTEKSVKRNRNTKITPNTKWDYTFFFCWAAVVHHNSSLSRALQFWLLHIRRAHTTHSIIEVNFRAVKWLCWRLIHRWNLDYERNRIQEKLAITPEIRLPFTTSVDRPSIQFHRVEFLTFAFFFCVGKPSQWWALKGTWKIYTIWERPSFPATK